MDLKDKARAKEARRAAKRNETPRTEKGPQIDWSAEVNPANGPVMPPAPPTPGAPDPGDTTDTDDD